MSYDTKKQLRDGGAQLIAQYFDELLDDYRPLSGDEHGTYMQDVQAKAALDQMLVRLTELPDDAKAEAIRVLLATMEGRQGQIKSTVDAIAGKDFATQATLAAVLEKLSVDPSTSAKQDAAKLVLDTISTAVAARASEATLAQVKTELAAVKSELESVKANQLSGDQKVQLSGSTEVTFPAAQPVQLSGRVVTEQKLTENLEIAAGAEVRIGTNSGFPVQCNALSFGVLCDANAKIGITLWPATFGGPANAYPTVLLDGSVTTSNLRAVSPLWTPVSTHVVPRVRNNSGVPVTVSVVMYRWFNTQQ